MSALPLLREGASRIELRPERPDDRPFLEALYASTREREMALLPWTDEQKRAFLASQFEAQHTYYVDRFADARFLVIEEAGAPIGRIYIHRRSDEIDLVDIALLPERRGSGIGTSLVRGVMDEAVRADLPLRLHVEHDNPARRLYDRLGFRVLENQGVYLRMEWRFRPERSGRVS
jgi:ribosomal protein S18 acetylase RimI-like enzyme